MRNDCPDNVVVSEDGMTILEREVGNGGYCLRRRRYSELLTCINTIFQHAFVEIREYSSLTVINMAYKSIASDVEKLHSGVAHICAECHNALCEKHR